MKSAGKPGNGSPEPDGARLQAVRLSLEILVIVVIRIAFRQLKVKADVLGMTEGNIPHCAMVSDGDTTGVRVRGM